MFSASLSKALRGFTRNPELLKVMDYAVLPAGKLFRPRLVEALAKDLSGGLSEDHLHLALALELHHAYTLVHDDLPSMDNDLIRRGRPSTHAAFGEWKAVLAGDALLIASFEELMKIRSARSLDVHRLFTWATGAKGLIEGQFEDLGAQGALSFPEVLRIHELKTARLIQAAALGTYMLSSSDLSQRREYLRLGREIGVSFQLLDDLGELTTTEVSAHEHEINPFLLNFDEASAELKKSHARLMKLLERHGLHEVRTMLLDFFKSSQQNLLQNFNVVETGLKRGTNDLKEWLTSFA